MKDKIYVVTKEWGNRITDISWVHSWIERKEHYAKS